MKKAGRILILSAGLGIMLGIAVRAEAKEGMGSRGAIQFQDIGENICIWSEDVALLQDRVSEIAQEPFDPAYYSAAGIDNPGPL